ncbi:MAG: outer membrane lipoprotein SlyB [Cellvibrionaceae bacterium]|jgi:outer membrane lipoprotein SlyB
MKTLTLFSFLLLVGLISGCANNSLTGDTYTREDARKVQRVEFGRVMSAKPVVIEGNREGIVGNIGGTVLGGIAGSSIGDGRGQAAGTLVGAAVGGILGQLTEEKLTRKHGQEIQIQMDDGRILSIVQEVEDEEFFKAGDEIRLLKLNGVTRVSAGS